MTGIPVRCLPVPAWMRGLSLPDFGMSHAPIIPKMHTAHFLTM
ncbi:hypothetical protein [Nitrosomonas sp. ANs5]